jgi:hypothetical protein
MWHEPFLLFIPEPSFEFLDEVPRFNGIHEIFVSLVTCLVCQCLEWRHSLERGGQCLCFFFLLFAPRLFRSRNSLLLVVSGRKTFIVNIMIVTAIEGGIQVVVEHDSIIIG